MTKPYHKFAKIYDEVMKPMPYDQWVKYLQDILSVHKIKDKEILDVACGTGTMLIMLAKKGYRCAGLDKSSEMLNIARKKAKNNSVKIEFINADMVNFRLKRKVPIITCMYDSINYLLKKEQIKNFFKKAYASLSNNGIFIFDMNTEYALKNIWGTKTTFSDNNEMTSIWKSKYGKVQKTGYLEILYFIYSKGNYEKIKETHIEKAYDIQEIKEMLKKEGFKNMIAYKDRTFDKPGQKTPRVWFVARNNL